MSASGLSNASQNDGSSPLTYRTLNIKTIHFSLFLTYTSKLYKLLLLELSPKQQDIFKVTALLIFLPRPQMGF